jgi:hypothetical protein
MRPGLRLASADKTDLLSLIPHWESALEQSPTDYRYGLSAGKSATCPHRCAPRRWSASRSDARSRRNWSGSAAARLPAPRHLLQCGPQHAIGDRLQIRPLGLKGPRTGALVGSRMAFSESCRASGRAWTVASTFSQMWCQSWCQFTLGSDAFSCVSVPDEEAAESPWIEAIRALVREAALTFG